MIAPVRRAGHLDRAEIADVLALATVAGDADGAYPLSESFVRRVRLGGAADGTPPHLLAREPDGVLAGYAQLDLTDPAGGPSAELVVHPLHRRRGHGRALLAAVITASGQHDSRGRLRLWAHGDHPSAGALALDMGFTRARELWQMRRPMSTAVPAPDLPAGVTIRQFQPGQDDEAWVRVNARAFASHPEQGRWTLRDLHARMAEPWFDPAGFLLAVRGDELLGFHWTKVHGPEETRSDAAAGRPPVNRPIGEVYVLGVDPDQAGLGLGGALALAGLRHLQARGLPRVMLYVDETNSAAVRLYSRLGFARWTTHVSYARRFTRPQTA